MYSSRAQHSMQGRDRNAIAPKSARTCATSCGGTDVSCSASVAASNCSMLLLMRRICGEQHHHTPSSSWGRGRAVQQLRTWTRIHMH